MPMFHSVGLQMNFFGCSGITVCVLFLVCAVCVWCVSCVWCVECGVWNGVCVWCVVCGVCECPPLSNFQIVNLFIHTQFSLTLSDGNYSYVNPEW
jgi:hypothetical protein